MWEIPLYLVSAMHILLLNGPNLNLLGKREPGVYGGQSFPDYLAFLEREFPEHTLSYQQSNHEGELLDILHHAENTYQGIILNAGAYTHTSIALADAVKAIDMPVVEVHISNVFAREAFRQHSYLSPVCAGTITGMGMAGYALAIRFFTDYHQQPL